MKKKRNESIFIPNQADKNPRYFCWHRDNSEDEKQRIINEERRKKHALKSK